MAHHRAVDEVPGAEECWCCGTTDAPERMIHLGNHPEVALCLGCAKWASKQAWEIEDRQKAGPGVLVRGRLRAARQFVIDRGWHDSRWFGKPLRWLGNHLP